MAQDWLTFAHGFFLGTMLTTLIASYFLKKAYGRLMDEHEEHIRDMAIGAALAETIDEHDLKDEAVERAKDNLTEVQADLEIQKRKANAKWPWEGLSGLLSGVIGGGDDDGDDDHAFTAWQLECPKCGATELRSIPSEGDEIECPDEECTWEVTVGETNISKIKATRE